MTMLPDELLCQTCLKLNSLPSLTSLKREPFFSKIQVYIVLQSTRFELAGRQKKEDLWPGKGLLKSFLRMEFHFHSIVSISSPYAKKLYFKGKKEIEVGDGFSGIHSWQWTLVQHFWQASRCPPFHSRLSIAGDRKPIGQAIVASIGG